MNIKLWLKLALTLMMLTAFTGLATAQQKSERKVGPAPSPTPPAPAGANPSLKKCDLTINKIFDPDTHILTSGGNATFTIFLRNVGTAPCPPPTTVADAWPPGLTWVSTTPGAGWTCLGPPVNCTTNTLTLQPPPFIGLVPVAVIHSTVNALPGTVIVNCATVRNSNDTNPNYPGYNKVCIDERVSGINTPSKPGE